MKSLKSFFLANPPLLSQKSRRNDCFPDIPQSLRGSAALSLRNPRLLARFPAETLEKIGKIQENSKKLRFFCISSQSKESFKVSKSGDLLRISGFLAIFLEISAGFSGIFTSPNPEKKVARFLGSISMKFIAKTHKIQ